MAGELRLDETGVSSLVTELNRQAADSDDHTKSADAALSAAVGSLISSPVAEAMERLAARLRNHGGDVGTRMTNLGSALTVTATTITATDGDLAAAAKRMGQ
jgi:hypothetical protein